MANIYDKISTIVSKYLNTLSEKNRADICRALEILLGERVGGYAFDISDTVKNYIDLQNDLYKINEKSEQRKNKGVYYTPEDVCMYIVLNTVITMCEKENNRTYKEDDAIDRIKAYNRNEVEELLFKKKFFDPACGSGEFLINVFKCKYKIAQTISDKNSDDDIYRIAKTIFGNDIDSNSTDISKIRLFFEMCRHIVNTKYYFLIADVLNKQFSNEDFVIYNGRFNSRFDCVIGNPPYVEYGKYEKKELLVNGFGNIYADVIKNSVSALKKEGVFGFIVPLSYISTSRMADIRNYIAKKTEREFILNFADRPDCLFQGVHQKLNIVIARKGKERHKLFTSNYKHWYKEERKTLLNGCEIIENEKIFNEFIPKIGNYIEDRIYSKITVEKNNNLIDIQNEQGTALYLNMRACFWIKAFTFNPGSNEYKVFRYDDTTYSYIHCLLNSSLFWLFWTITSDCWHITKKELKRFRVPTLSVNEYSQFEDLSKNLEEKLELTKKFIGTKQVDYEYKHKDCKKEIDLIDERLARVYNLTQEELEYVKGYALKYRLGSGADDKND